MRGLLLGLLILGAVAGGALPCLAQSFDSEEELNEYVHGANLSSSQAMFILQSLHPNIVDVEFYAQSRRRAWPGGGEIFSLKDSRYHVFVLNCEVGEQICYGAGVRSKSGAAGYNSYWGVGINQRAGCSDCCIACDGGRTNIVVLN